MFSMCRQLEKILPINIDDQFFRRQEFNFDHLWQQEYNRINRKIINLRRKHISRELSNIKNINYNIIQRSDYEMSDASNAPLITKNVFDKMISNKTDSVYNIKIDPGSFNTKFDISNTNEKQLINLSKVDIPNKAKIVLQLGQHFNLSNNLTNKERIT